MACHPTPLEGRPESDFAFRADMTVDWMQFILSVGADAPPTDTSSQNPMATMLWLFIPIALAFYLIIIRPQKRDQATKERMISALERGDRVVTIGGIHGIVAGVDEAHKTVTVDVGKGVRIEFSRAAISTVEKKSKKAAEETGN